MSLEQLDATYPMGGRTRVQNLADARRLCPDDGFGWSEPEEIRALQRFNWHAWRAFAPDRLYVIQEESPEAFIKVGISKSPRARLASLQGPRSLILAFCSAPIRHWRALDIERHCHERLAPWRVSGEWYRANLQFVVARLIECGAHREAVR